MTMFDHIRVMLSASKTIKVYRLGGHSAALDNRNGANLLGLDSFLMEMFDKDYVSRAYGDTVHAFEVEVELPFGPYVRFDGGRGKSGPQVGKLDESGSVWYSFPANGNWKIKRHLGSKPLDKLTEPILVPVDERKLRAKMIANMEGELRGVPEFEEFARHGGAKAAVALRNAINWNRIPHSFDTWDLYVYPGVAEKGGVEKRYFDFSLDERLKRLKKLVG